MTELPIALLQMRSVIDREENTQTIEASVREAAAAGAKVICTPEMSTVVDRDTRRLIPALPDPADDPSARRFDALAQELGIFLFIGSSAVGVETQTGRKMANRAQAYGPEGRLGFYDKIHLFDVDLPTGESWRESAKVHGGEEAVLVKTPLGGFGLTICYDVRFPHLYRQLAQAGADVLMVPAAFTVPTGEAHWHTLLRARAIENGCYVVAAAQGGRHEDGRATYGHSLVIDPWGEIVAEKPDDEPGLLYAALDLAKVADARARIPSLGLDHSSKLRTYTV